MTSRTSIHVQSGGREFVLINLNEKLIQVLEKDAERLSRYFNHCLITGENICNFEVEAISTNDENCSPSVNDVPSTSGSGIKRTSIKKSAEVTANLALAPIRKSTSAIANKRKSAASLEHVDISTDTYTAPSTSKAKKALSKEKKATAEEQKLSDEMLVSLVMDQPMLYNFRLNSNKFAGTKAEKWGKICAKLNAECPNAELSIAKTKDRWAHLRDEYLGRQRLNAQSSGAGFKETEEDQFDEVMSGLLDIYVIEKTMSNVPEPGKIPGDSAEGATAKSHRIQKKIEEETVQIIESTSDKFLLAVEDMKNSFLAKKDVRPAAQDKVSMFCDMLCFDLRELNDGQFLKAQIEILQVVQKLQQQQ